MLLNKKKVSVFIIFCLFCFATFLSANSKANALVIVNPIEVYVKDLKLSKTDYRAGETVTGTFTLWNAKNLSVPNVRYEVFLMGNYKNTIPQKQYDNSIMYGPIFLAGNEKKVVNFTYKIPESISGANLGIEVVAMLDNGSSMGWDDAMLNIAGGTGMAEIKSAGVYVGDTAFNVQEGPTIYAGQKAVLNVVLENNTADKITITPSVNIYKRPEPNNILSSFKDKTITINPNAESKISIDLPAFNYAPQVYVGEISFLDSNNVKRATTVNFRYIIGGDIVTIDSVASDKSSIAEGQTLNITINYAGSPTDIMTNKVSGGGPADLNVKIFNQNNKLVANYSDKTDFNAGYTKTISVKALANALAMRAEITASKDGKTLASYKTNLSSDYAKQSDKMDARDYFSLRIILAVIFVLILFVGIIFIKKLLKRKILLAILIIILIVLATAFFFISKAGKAEAMECVGNTCLDSETYSANTTFAIITNVFVNSPVDTLTCGSQGYLQVSAVGHGCENLSYNFCLSSPGLGQNCIHTFATPDHTTESIMTFDRSALPFLVPVADTGTINFTLDLHAVEGNYYETLQLHQNYSISCPDACGSAAKNYTAGSTAFTGNFCNHGNPVSISNPYIWIANSGDNTVTKLNISNGNVIGTYNVGNNPQEVAVDASGNVWVANNGGNSVTKLDSSGNTIGTYNVGYGPRGIAIDEAGNVWVANSGGNNVTKLHSDGTQYSGSPYSVESGAYGIAVDPSGNAWVTDSGGNSVTKLNSSTGAIIAISSVGNNPYGIAVNAYGNVWVANAGSNSVTKLDSSGNVLGTYPVGNNPRGIAVDSSGNVWVANFDDNTVTELNSLGNVIGTYSSGVGAFGNNPYGVAVDAYGNVWVANSGAGNNGGRTVTKLDSSGSRLGTYSVGKGPYSFGDFTGFALQYFNKGFTPTFPTTNTPTTTWSCGNSTACAATLQAPLCADSGLRIWNGSESVHIAGQAPGTATSPLRIKENSGIWGVVLVNPGDPNDSGIRIQTNSGTKALKECSTGSASPPATPPATPSSIFVWVANFSDNTVTKLDGSNGNLLGTYPVGNNPDGVAVDSSGNVWVGNWMDGTVTKLNSSGSVVGTYSLGGYYPSGIATDSSGNVWVASSGGNKVIKLNGSTGATIGTYNVGSLTWQVATDSSGNVWVGSLNGNTVTKLNSAGSVVGTYSAGNETYGVAVDASGNVWVANRLDGTVTKLSSSGNTIGTYDVGNNPSGVATDSSGNVWVTNSDNNVIKLNSSGNAVGTYHIANTLYRITADASGNVWVGNFNGNTVTKLNSSGIIIGTYNVGNHPYGIAVSQQ
ncbi:MAG: SMP-30/gluconolactonase/LRE family protein [Candidatus Staskawiczbacteria bacterium]|nr:SMP-30/gluconolactonase/LRE family protein [Candidatus Staskawiczbacteria bacterium]